MSEGRMRAILAEVMAELDDSARLALRAGVSIVLVPGLIGVAGCKDRPVPPYSAPPPAPADARLLDHARPQSSTAGLPQPVVYLNEPALPYGETAMNEKPERRWARSQLGPVLIGVLRDVTSPVELLVGRNQDGPLTLISVGPRLPAATERALRSRLAGLTADELQPGRRYRIRYLPRGYAP